MLPSTIAAIARLPTMTVAQLRDHYHTTFGEPTASRHKTWLVRRIAWRLQANDEGGAVGARAETRSRARQRRGVSRHGAETIGCHRRSGSNQTPDGVVTMVAAGKTMRELIDDDGKLISGKKIEKKKSLTKFDFSSIALPVTAEGLRIRHELEQAIGTGDEGKISLLQSMAAR